MKRLALQVALTVVTAGLLAGCASNGHTTTDPVGPTQPPTTVPTLVPTLRLATQFAVVVADAASRRDQSRLPSPGDAGGHWTDLVRYLGGQHPHVHCREDAPNNFDCGVAFVPGGKDRAYFYVAVRKGHWTVAHVSDVID